MLGEAVRGHRSASPWPSPPAVTWPLPAYELAIMTRTELDMQGGREVVVTVVTAEHEPLAIFGDEAGAALRELLARRRIRLGPAQARARHRGRPVARVRRGGARGHRDQPAPARGPAHPGTAVRQPRVHPHRPGRLRHRPRARGRRRHRLPGQAGRPGRPAGRRRGGHDRPAARRPRAPRPFTTPVLRGVLLTGGAPLYLRPSSIPPASRCRPRSGGCAARSPRGRCGGRRARSPAATSRRTWPPRGHRCRPTSRSSTSRRGFLRIRRVAACRWKRRGRGVASGPCSLTTTARLRSRPGAS